MRKINDAPIPSDAFNRTLGVPPSPYAGAIGPYADAHLDTGSCDDDHDDPVVTVTNSDADCVANTYRYACGHSRTEYLRLTPSMRSE